MLFLISGSHSIRTHKMMHNIPCLQIQPVDGPKAGVLLPLNIEGVHLLSTTQAICPSPTMVEYLIRNEEASNAIESTLQIFDQHVNVANLVMKGSEVRNWMEPHGNDENQLLLQERIVSKQNFSFEMQDNDLQPEYSHPQSSTEFTKIAAELEVIRSVHVHDSNMEQTIMQAERRPLRDYNFTQHPIPRSPSIASVEGVEAISQIINDLSSSDTIRLSLLGLNKCCYCLHPCLYFSFAFGQFLAL